jgi:8-oxo-dGTP diphosphatase
MDKRPKVGIGVTIIKDGKLLLGKRKNAHGKGQYASPGGHLEFGESFEDCARRETLEESGIQIDNIRFQYLANIKKYGGKHYVHIGLISDWKSGDPQQLEPEKCEGWTWYSMDALPEPLFEMTQLTIESLRTRCNYYDS